MTSEGGNRGPIGIDASPSGSWLTSPGTLSDLRGSRRVEGERRSYESPREIAVGTQRTSIPQRVWEIRVDSVLKSIAMSGAKRMMTTM